MFHSYRLGTMMRFLMLSMAIFAVAFGSQLPLRQCAQIGWTDPAIWYAGDKLIKTWTTPNCSTLVTQNDYYKCSIVQPPIQCLDNSCPPGTECSGGTVPPLCTSCNLPPSPPFYTDYDYNAVIVNVTESMLNGTFWTYNDFYNHTGVDLVLTLYRWLWSPNLQALEQDYVQQWRTTWGDNVDSDMFKSFSKVYQIYNSTHVEERVVALGRTSYDVGEIEMSSSSVTTYLPIAQITHVDDGLFA